MSVHGHQQLSLFNARLRRALLLRCHCIMTPSARVPSRSCCAPARPIRHPECALLRRSCAISVNAGRGRASRPRRLATPTEAIEWCEANRVDYIRPARFEAAGEEDRREAAEAVRTERACRRTISARLCRNTPARPILEPRAARRRPASKPHPLRRHQRRIRRGGIETPSIARAGRPRTSSSCTRRSSLPIEPCRSAIATRVPPRSHSGLLAHAHRSRRHPQTARSRQRRVLDLAAAADQEIRSPRHRNRKPHSSRFPPPAAPRPRLFHAAGALSALGP